MPSILVVEDDAVIGGALEAALRVGGYDVTWQRSAGSALITAAGRTFELVLLDLGLPDRDGVDLCRDLRALSPSTVIVMLTARQNEMDIISGLDAGADDYLTKPFKISEILARLRAHLRRSVPHSAGSGGPPDIKLGAVTVSPASRRIAVDAVEVVLRAREFDLLLRLAVDAGTAVSRETLMADVWDEHWFASTKTLDVHMVAVRRKLSATALQSHTPMARMPVITTLRGHGYRLDGPAVDNGAAPT